MESVRPRLVWLQSTCSELQVDSAWGLSGLWFCHRCNWQHCQIHATSMRSWTSQSITEAGLLRNMGSFAPSLPVTIKTRSPLWLCDSSWNDETWGKANFSQHQRRPNSAGDGLRDGVPTGILMTVMDSFEVEISSKFPFERHGNGSL